MKKNAKGSFTLVEIILALAVLGIGLVSILSIFIVGMNSVRRAVRTTEASFIAQMAFEDYKVKGYGSAEIGSHTYSNINDSTNSAIYSSYTYEANISDVPIGGMQNVSNPKRIDLTVKSNGSKVADFTTYIANCEP